MILFGFVSELSHRITWIEKLGIQNSFFIYNCFNLKKNMFSNVNRD